MEEFDFVIAGAGSAGCVLANRLSADAGNRVCLIEAGPRDSSALIHVPLGMLPLMHHAVLNWRYSTVPQAHAANRRIYAPRGKTLGGSSSINGMVYLRGHRLDYDDWAAAGNAGWSHREVLPYFLRSECNQNFGAPWHATDGPLNVTQVESHSPLVGMLREAAQSLGLPLNDDFNGAEQEGFGPRQATIKNGRRQSTAAAFLRPVLGRPNLTVLTDCLVDKVTFAGRRATGLLVIQRGAKRSIVARREVILSAGSYASPAILLRSGIGDGAQLRRFAIPSVHQLPGVGRNLHDHLINQISHVTDSTVPYGLSLAALPWAAWQVVKYALFRNGIFANNVLHACGYVRSSAALDRPDLQYVLMPANRTPENPGVRGHGYGLIMLLLRPLSRGRVSLASADPETAPMIDPRFLSEPADLELVLRGLKLGRRILAAPAWDAIRGRETLPGEQVTDNAGLAEYVRQRCATAFHPVGTCKMGTSEADAVVDPQLRVWGVQGLRVVDASIMPRITGGGTNAPTIMIAEKASDMILGRPPLPAIPEAVLRHAAAPLNPDKISRVEPVHEAV